MENPNVIWPEGFDVDAAWKGCREWRDSHEAGSIGAAMGADPGCCSCPACKASYWAWGTVIRCKCGFEFPAQWWSDYSDGVNAGMAYRKSGQKSWRVEQRRKNPYFREGFDNPPETDAYRAKDLIDWRTLGLAPIADLLPLGNEHCPRCGALKEGRRQNQPLGLCVKCDSETECRYRCSMLEKQCLAGVVFAELRETFAEGETFPCYYWEGRKAGHCSKFEPMSREEIEAEDKESDEHLSRFLLAMPIVEQIKKQYKGKSWRGTRECPACKGVLHLSHAKCNGHVHGECETEGCLQWCE